MSGDDRRFPLIQVAGGPYEMGRTHGEVGKALIQRSMLVCQDVLPVPFARAVDYCLPSLAHASAAAPELVEEVRGIAHGSGFTPAEIFALNASLDLQLSGERTQCAMPPDCWAAAVNGDVTADGHTYVMWTAEDSARWLDSCILLEVRPEGGLPCLMWTFAGFIGRPGLNPYLGLSATAQSPQACGDGLPYPFICRQVFQQQTTADAVAAVADAERMAGMSYTIGDRAGELATLITSAGHCRELEHAPGWTAVTGWQPEARVQRIGELLQERAPGITLEYLQRVQRDHGPGNLCAHSETGLTTLCAFVADVQAGELWVAYGSPCEREHVRYRLC